MKRRGCAVPFFAAVILWAIFFLGFCAGKAVGAQEEPMEPVAEQVIRTLVEAADACEMPVGVSVDQLMDPVDVSGIGHLAGVDAEAVLTLESEPQLVSLGSWKITAYCACKKCCGKDPDHPKYGITATGTVATQGRTIAADPKVLPYGTVVVIDGHEYIVEDCGGAIKNQRIDVYFDTHEEALQWGVKHLEVFTYEEDDE